MRETIIGKTEFARFDQRRLPENSSNESADHPMSSLCPEYRCQLARKSLAHLIQFRSHHLLRLQAKSSAMLAAAATRRSMNSAPPRMSWIAVTGWLLLSSGSSGTGSNN